MNGVKSYLHKYVEQLGTKVVFSDNSSCITEGYGLINREGISFTKVAFVNSLKYNLISISQLCKAKYIVQFNDKQGTICNANKEIVLIAPRRNDVYVFDMPSLTPNEACFFAISSKSIKWLWYKRISHLNFKNINKLAKQNKVLGFPSLVYSKDKPCTTCEKGKYHRASFKTEQNFSIRKCLHLLHMDLFGPVSPMYINHKKYTLVIIDEYSRYTWVYFLRKKSQASKMIISFIRMVENQNNVKVKQIRTDNGTEFKNHKLESSVMRKEFLKISPLLTLLNKMDHLGKFDAKADDGYFLGYSSVSKDFKVYNTRRQQIEETYHVTFDESMESVRMMITQPTDVPSGNNNEVSRPITEPLVPDDTQSHILNQASTNSYPAPRDRWSSDRHIELVNIIINLREGMLTRSMAAKLIAVSASECLFADFLSEIEPKKVSEALKHPRWIDVMQEELNQFYRNKVWTLFTLPYGKIAIGSKWIFKNKKNEHGRTTKNKARLVAQVKTPMVPPNNLGPDLAGKAVNETSYRGMLRYLKGTLTLGLYYPKCSGFDLKRYSNSDYAGYNMDRKITSGACQILSGKLVCWSAKKQQSVAISSAEAKYTTDDGCCARDIKLHFIPTEYQLVDIFTKPLDKLTFTRLKAELGMLNIE
nr:retrovirus-related Pol polyprotein from transposon TNT 1-94 [Tanacetum cinerariifolium]